MKIPALSVARRHAHIIRQNGVDANGRGQVQLLWQELVGGSLDPSTGAQVGATATPRHTFIPGLVHFISAATVERRFAEVQVGDCLVDLLPDAPVDNLTGLRFRINGEEWVPKDIPALLARQWDTVVGGVRLTRTLLLRKAS